jgi:hypothetical protein
MPAVLSAGVLLAALGSLPSLPIPACQLLTLEEVERVLGGPVTIDPSQSGGPDYRGADDCAWQTKDQRTLVLSVLVDTTVERADIRLTQWSVDAFGGGGAPDTLHGPFDEAHYRAFEQVQGGALIARKANVVVSLSGPLPRATIVYLGRLVLSRVTDR